MGREWQYVTEIPMGSSPVPGVVRLGDNVYALGSTHRRYPGWDALPYPSASARLTPHAWAIGDTEILWLTLADVDGYLRLWAGRYNTATGQWTEWTSADTFEPSATDWHVVVGRESDNTWLVVISQALYTGYSMTYRFTLGGGWSSNLGTAPRCALEGSYARVLGWLARIGENMLLCGYTADAGWHVCRWQDSAWVQTSLEAVYTSAPLGTPVATGYGTRDDYAYALVYDSGDNTAVYTPQGPTWDWWSQLPSSLYGVAIGHHAGDRQPAVGWSNGSLYLYEFLRGPWLTGLNASWTPASHTLTVSWVEHYRDAEGLSQSAYRVLVTDPESGATIYDSTKVTSAVKQVTVELPSVPPPAYVLIRVWVWNEEDMESDPVLAWVHTGPGGGGYHYDGPPTVELLEPEQGATVAGVVKIRGVASDDVGLSRVEIWLNGVLVDAENVQGTSVEFETEWDTDGWENGLVVITARAYDTLGQVGQDSVTVYVDNLLAAEGKVIYTKRQPQTGSSWRLGGASPVYGMSTVLLSPAPSNPRRRYNVRVGYHVPGDTYDLSQYTLVPTDRRYLLPRTAQTIRWAIWAEPQLTTAFWQAGQATRFVRLVSSGGKIYAVSEGPVAVWLLAGDVAMQADLSRRFGAGRAYDAVVHDGKVLIGTDVGLIAWDTDAGDEPVLVLLGSGEIEVPAVAASGSNAYIATAGGLLRWDYPSPRRVATSAPVSAGSLGLAASAVVAADDTAVRYLSGSSWQQVYTLPGAARRVWTRQVGSTWEVWVGIVGGVVSSNPDWHQAGEFSGRTAVALAEYLGTIIAGTNSATYGPALLRRTMDGWSVFYTLPVAEVHDLLVAGRTLYAACGESPASIHAIVVAEDSQLVSGPEPPRFLMKILDYVRRSTND